MRECGETTEQDAALTLRDLMGLSAMAGARLLSGGDQMDRPILRTNVVEGVRLSEWAQRRCV